MTTPKRDSQDQSPDDLAQERLAHLVKAAARAFIRALEMRLAEHTPASYGHWTMLRILWSHDGLSQRELSEWAGVTESTTQTAVKALEALGYVERIHLPGNNKKVHVFLTRTGKALKRKLVPLAEEVNEISVQDVTAEEVAITRKVLLAVARNLARDEEAAAGTGRRVRSTREVGRGLADV
jgi:DNA-binding MarR family transcriptional regulator